MAALELEQQATQVGKAKAQARLKGTSKIKTVHILDEDEGALENSSSNGVDFNHGVHNRDAVSRCGPRTAVLLFGSSTLSNHNLQWILWNTPDTSALRVLTHTFEDLIEQSQWRRNGRTSTVLLVSGVNLTGCARSMSSMHGKTCSGTGQRHLHGRLMKSLASEFPPGLSEVFIRTLACTIQARWASDFFRLDPPTATRELPSTRDGVGDWSFTQTSSFSLLHAVLPGSLWSFSSCIAAHCHKTENEFIVLRLPTVLGQECFLRRLSVDSLGRA